MAVESITNLVPGLGYQPLDQAQNNPPGIQATAPANPGPTPIVEDTFTPSAQNNAAQATAQDAGIFQVNPAVLTQATTTLALLQGADANQNGTAPQPAATPVQNPDPPQANAAANANTTAATNGAQAANDPATSAAVQNKIQALNAALPALGLTNTQIEEIDRIAALDGDFNPSAYANLVNQFETQSAQTAQQNGGVGAAIPPPGTATANTATNGSGNGSEAPGLAAQANGLQLSPANGVGALQSTPGGNVPVNGQNAQNPPPANPQFAPVIGVPQQGQNATPQTTGNTNTGAPQVAQVSKPA